VCNGSSKNDEITPLFMVTVKLKNLLPSLKLSKKLRQSAKLPNPNFHRQTTLKNAKFELFGNPVADLSHAGRKLVENMSVLSHV